MIFRGREGFLKTQKAKKTQSEKTSQRAGEDMRNASN